MEKSQNEKLVDLVTNFLVAKYNKNTRMFGPKTARIVARVAAQEGWVTEKTLKKNNITPTKLE